MGHWNHRVIEARTEEGPWLALHEVHYYDDGRLMGYTKEPVDVSGETTAELLETLERMKRALDKPILRDADFAPRTETRKAPDPKAEGLNLAAVRHPVPASSGGVYTSSTQP